MSNSPCKQIIIKKNTNQESKQYNIINYIVHELFCSQHGFTSFYCPKLLHLLRIQLRPPQKRPGVCLETFVIEKEIDVPNVYKDVVLH